MATSTLGSGTLVLAGTTSGTTTVTATAVAGTTTLTLPAATDTLVGKATTDTLTNKTLTGAVMNGTVGATTPSTGAFTSVSASTTLGVTGVSTFSAGTAALPAITTTGDTNTGIWFPAADTIAFTRGGAESMRINSSGSVLIGCTTNPTSSISGKEIGTYFQSSCGTTTTSFTHFFFTNGNGNVGTIQTNGSATTYNTSSDYRLKGNIAPMTGALAKVAQLKPVTYKWKVDGADGEGFIAHELAEVVPQCVSGEKDATRQEEYEVTPAVKDEQGNTTTPAVMGTRTVPDYQGVDTSFLVATLTAAIQELKAVVEAQATRIATLEAK